MNNKDKVITKVEQQKKNKDRVNIFVNDEFLLGCSIELVYTHNLIKGKKVDVEYLKELVDEDNYIKCKNSALKIIERSYKTEKQVLDKLVQKEYDEKTIFKAINFLKQYNLLNDEKYVEMYVKDKLKSYGRNKIKYDLIRKGISEELINSYLGNVDYNTEKNAALKLAQKKYRIIAKSETDSRKIYKKLGDYLARNGYNFDVIEKVLHKVINEDISSISEDEAATIRINKEIGTLYELAEKRYRIIMKSECDNKKAYKKLSEYLLRRGYSWEDIKLVLKSIVENSYI
ncbi:recombination regulator RecX [Clostridium sp. DJ247]|uniref:recombination regulator RecX n=1 Tax=Clostridium sp. DJ247 TaxID=2726188 RepID=UPI00162A80E1|nr:recombination regulator RecX [Clostridium sp. DJ247]MBC2579781.1 recombination regulator RecX [Clostridium sp. DJ247]